jgi:prepilin-type N-terminal cleavage/methylation domain-containing protein
MSTRAADRESDPPFRDCAESCPPSGFGLVELIVAMTLLSVGVLGLVAASTLAQQSLNAAAATAQATNIAAALADSLLRSADADTAGERAVGNLPVRWTVQADSALVRVRVEVDVPEPAGARTVEFNGARLRAAPG